MEKITPVITTRYAKGEVLSHSEMDKNFCSLIHTASISEKTDIKDAQYITFSYAPNATEYQADDIVVQLENSAEELCKKISGETIPGNLSIEGDLIVGGHISGSWMQEKDQTVQSDERLKEDIIPMYGCLQKVMSIDPVEFKWKKGAEKTGSDVGVIAQNVQNYYYQAVSKGADGYLRVDYSKFVPLLIGAVRDLQNEVLMLKDRLGEK